MKVIETRIPGCLIVKHDSFVDPRGSFSSVYDYSEYRDSGLPTTFLQDNFSVSFKGVVRGLHLQRRFPPGKLVRCLGGSIFDVCVDLRPNSPTFGKWEGVHLSWEHPLAFYIPPGCAHGFYVTGDAAAVYYKCTTQYDKESDGGISWCDADVSVDWPMRPGTPVILSPRDKELPSLRDYLAAGG